MAKETPSWRENLSNSVTVIQKKKRSIKAKHNANIKCKLDTIYKFLEMTSYAKSIKILLSGISSDVDQIMK
jgi:hypothetical protein